MVQVGQPPKSISILLTSRSGGVDQDGEFSGRIIEGWNLVVGKGGNVYDVLKKQYDGVAS